MKEKNGKDLSGFSKAQKPIIIPLVEYVVEVVVIQKTVAK